MEKKHRIVQISDLHLLKLRYEANHGIAPARTFRRILDGIQELDPKPEAIILSGDVSDAGYPESYYLVDRILMSLEIPYYWIPGNHDDVDIMASMEEGLSVEKDKAFELGGRSIVLLDSVIPDEVAGRLAPTEIAFLKESLQSDHPALVFLHHHPINRIEKLKQYMLLNAEEFFKALEELPQVEAVFFGHTHVAYENLHQGVRYFSSPPSVFPYKEINKTTRYSMPGYRLIEWEEGSPMETSVHEIDLDDLLE